jgi:hypothetical protein
MKKNKKLKWLMSLTLITFMLVPGLAQDERGDLWLLEQETVSPSARADYIQWGKEFKALADKTNFRSFFAESANDNFYYAWNIGKDFAGLDVYRKEFGEWASSNPAVNEMAEKYSHSLISRTSYVWRHQPKYSYSIEGHDSSSDTYTRQYRAWIKQGKWQEAMAILTEYAAIMKEGNSSYPYNVFNNVFGLEQNVIAIRSTYKDAADWVASMKEGEEKFGEKLQDIYKRWGEVIEKGEDLETWISKDLTHVSQD